jgi:hemolysin activation/secretion protein
LKHLPIAAALLAVHAAAALFATPAHAQAPANAQAAASAQAAAVPRFDILEYRIEGNTVLAVELIERAVYPFLGEARTADDVENARAALELVYRNAGFGTVAVDTPEQQVRDGVVMLQVREAPVSRLRVVGARHFSQQRILAQVPALAEGTVPNFPRVGEQLAQVNRSADRRVNPLLRPGREPGTTEVDLVVEDRLPLHGQVELHNRHAANTTPTRLAASLRYDNLFQREHGIGLQLQLSPQRREEVAVLGLSYTVPSPRSLLSWSLLRSDSTVATGSGDTSVLGRGTVAGLRWIGLFPGAEGTFSTVTLGVDWKDFDENVRIGAPAAGQPAGFSTPIRYLPFTVGYTTSLGGERGRWQAGIAATWSVRGLVADEAEFEDKRFGGQGNFLALRVDLTREQPLPRGWTAVLDLDAQLASQPLIGNEQFVAGGAGSVRGYLDAAATGDQALRGSLELRSPLLLAGRWPGVEGLRAHAFLDGARLQVRRPLPGQLQTARLLGLGLGLSARTVARAAGPKGALSLELAVPLQETASTSRSDVRLHASGSVEF